MDDFSFLGTHASFEENNYRFDIPREKLPKERKMKYLALIALLGFVAAQSECSSSRFKTYSKKVREVIPDATSLG